MLELLILAFMNMTETYNISMELIVQTGTASLGYDIFFSLLVLSIVIVGYAKSEDAYGRRNIAIIPMLTILCCTTFSFLIPAGTSIILWIIGIFLAGGSVLWKVAFKRKGEI